MCRASRRNYQTVYQSVPVPQNASPQTRDLIDMSDAAAQAAMKRAIAIDAIADTEMQAANRSITELAQAAPGTAPMVEAEAAAWLVRANAYTQSALGDVMRVRADLAGQQRGAIEVQRRQWRPDSPEHTGFLEVRCSRCSISKPCFSRSTTGSRDRRYCPPCSRLPRPSFCWRRSSPYTRRTPREATPELLRWRESATSSWGCSSPNIPTSSET